jgi:Predicted membrane protein
MGFGEAVSTCWKKYGDFDGRAQRPEFWWWILFVTLLQLAASIVLTVLLVVFQNAGFLQWLGVMIFMIVVLAVILPSIAVSVRRLHDRDLSGWWYLLGFVPFGSIVLLVWYVLPGTPGPNRYGD